MIAKFRRYWKAFFLLIRFNEYVFYVIEKECLNQSEIQKGIEDDKQYLKDLQSKQFARRNYADVSAGRWVEGTD